MDDVAEAIMDRIRSLEMKPEYSREDIAALVEARSGSDFEVSRFCVGLFLGFSKDKLEVELKERLGEGGTGTKRYQKDQEFFLDVLEEMGLRDAIIQAKRPDTNLLFVTDGLTWKARQNDLRKIVLRQNDGRITRIYTKQMRDQFVDDLQTLKVEFGI
ncbi:hypothetical protein [uncultured Roseibium sp.]|uniref:hypothetical protein n=1 Tax=uncultured Roseibium sp. TaxID=1936171 RepID=UPI00261A2C94|nr:hypothetical protein [uncultured Roseibium sp.]